MPIHQFPRAGRYISSPIGLGDARSTLPSRTSYAGFTRISRHVHLARTSDGWRIANTLWELT